MRKIALVAAALLACGVAKAQTASPLYVELGYTGVSIEADDVDADPGAVRAVLGYDLGPNLAVEAMAAYGVRDDDVSVGGISADVEVKHAYGLYLKPKMMLGDSLELFGRAGWARSKIDVSGLGSESESDFSYGIGVAYRFTNSFYAAVDYMNYLDKDDVEADGFTLSIGYRF